MSISSSDIQLPQILKTLAPTSLAIRRKERYDGGGMSVSLKEFDPEDISYILRVYNTIKTVYDIWLYAGMHQNQLDFSLFKNQMNYLNTTEFLTSVRSIGANTYSRGNPSAHIRQVVHDIRGGCLMSLIGYAGLLATDSGNLNFLKTAISLARDHAKMMRNAIHDLDVPVRIADESVKIHGIYDFVNKLDKTVIKIADKTAKVSVYNAFDGNISNRCLETSAIDRIVYNYLNNAARFTSDGTIKLTIFQPNDQVVRWVVENPISDNHSAWLIENVNNDLSALFLSGITRGGSGIGLNNCAEFVAQSFGINNIKDTVKNGYLGAKCIQNRFYAWFHWPVYIPKNNDEQHCTCKP